MSLWRSLMSSMFFAEETNASPGINLSVLQNGQTPKVSIVASLGSAPERLPVEAATERLTPKTGTSSKNIRTTIRCRARLRFECHGRSRPSHQLCTTHIATYQNPDVGSNKRRAVQTPVMCGPIYFQSFTRFRSFTA